MNLVDPVIIPNDAFDDKKARFKNYYQFLAVFTKRILHV